MGAAASKVASFAIGLTILAWLLFSFGLIFARFVVTDPAPNVVITFSDKGLTRLFVELISFGIGGLGFMLALFAFAGGARNRALTFTVVGSAAICIVCVTLLM